MRCLCDDEFFFKCILVPIYLFFPWLSAPSCYFHFHCHHFLWLINFNFHIITSVALWLTLNGALCATNSSARISLLPYSTHKHIYIRVYLHLTLLYCFPCPISAIPLCSRIDYELFDLQQWLMRPSADDVLVVCVNI